METWNTVIEGGRDSTSKAYHQWKAEVLKIRDMAEYKLYKLWKLNFTPADIEADKHWAIFPPDRATRQRKILGRTDDTPRGRTLGYKKKQWLYARALFDVADGLLTFHSLDQAMREATVKERDAFRELMKKFEHKSK